MRAWARAPCMHDLDEVRGRDAAVVVRLSCEGTAKQLVKQVVFLCDFEWVSPRYLQQCLSAFWCDWKMEGPSKHDVDEVLASFEHELDRGMQFWLTHSHDVEHGYVTWGGKGWGCKRAPVCKSFEFILLYVACHSFFFRPHDPVASITVWQKMAKFTTQPSMAGFKEGR